MGNPYVAALIVANAAFFLAAWVLYKLVAMRHDPEAARRSVLFLYLFPTAFIFSGGFSESLFLLLLVLSFFFAEREQWLKAGVSGFFLSLTRPLGIVAIVPLGIIFFRKNGGMKEGFYKLLCLGLVPLGVMFFFLYCYRLTGDFFAYSHIQARGWGYHLSNPFQVLWQGLTSEDVYFRINGVFALVSLIAVAASLLKVGIPYWLLGMGLVLIPLSSGVVFLQSISRYMLPVFPLYVFLGILMRHSRMCDLSMIAFALLQGFYMVFWSNGFRLTI